jgi:hypothetical protein
LAEDETMCRHAEGVTEIRTRETANPEQGGAPRIDNEPLDPAQLRS